MFFPYFDHLYASIPTFRTFMQSMNKEGCFHSITSRTTVLYKIAKFMDKRNELLTASEELDVGVSDDSSEISN
jgi:hypothetical protein